MAKSTHQRLSAARRLADEVALHRAAAEREGGAPTPSDYRHALRDVVSRCIFGVDKNPMAIQLAKTALWLEAYSPDRPLSFVDHHLRVGDALLGVLDPKVLENGIPDEAYTALSGDDKDVAAALKRQNKVDLESWRAISGEEPDPEDVTSTMKADPGFIVRPRYWVDERHVLARIARAPDGVRKHWWSLHFETDSAKRTAAIGKLLSALLSWLVGELFLRELGDEVLDALSPQQSHRIVAAVERQLETSHRVVWRHLREQGWTTRKGLKSMPSWGKDVEDARLSDDEVASLEQALASPYQAQVELLNDWLEQRSPRWLIGWRDICPCSVLSESGRRPVGPTGSRPEESTGAAPYLPQAVPEKAGHRQRA